MTHTDDDASELNRLGYTQELNRALRPFTNFALSLSIICILAGCITSFHMGLCTVGGPAITFGWPLACLVSLAVALTMGQVASAFPTAGGLYHWASILGGRGWGWVTAWFNLLGLLAVLAAINVGTYRFAAGAFGVQLTALTPATQFALQAVAMLLITGSQAAINARSLRITARLTDFSGFWILAVSVLLTGVFLAATYWGDVARLWRWEDFSGLPDPKDPVAMPDSPWWLLFLQALLLPAYTLTGFDASAHAAEETRSASREVPRGIVRSVLVSGVFGWVFLVAAVLAAPDLRETAAQGDAGFAGILWHAAPGLWGGLLIGAILVAQYLCGLATVTSTSRMMYAFARDGGLPASRYLRHVDPITRLPARAIWTVATASLLFTLWEPAYQILSASAALLLYVSYVLPTALGLWAFGRTWTRMGPWDLGGWYRPLGVVSVLGCLGLFAIAIQPPNQKTGVVVAAVLVFLLAYWFAWERRRFQGPPVLRDSLAQTR
jgi:amino acid transporter